MEGTHMIEISVTYDFRQDIDYLAYEAFVERAVGSELRAPGFIEHRAHRNISGSPQVRVTHVWKSLADWANFVESAESQTIDAEFRTFVTNINVQIWGPSPVVPEPLQAGHSLSSRPSS
jgi:heme-degrading monooxygenase HmoA